MFAAVSRVLKLHLADDRLLRALPAECDMRRIIFVLKVYRAISPPAPSALIDGNSFMAPPAPQSSTYFRPVVFSPPFFFCVCFLKLENCLFARSRPKPTIRDEGVDENLMLFGDRRCESVSGAPGAGVAFDFSSTLRGLETYVLE